MTLKTGVVLLLLFMLSCVVCYDHLHLPSIPLTGYPTLDQSRADNVGMFTDDFGQLGRYRGENSALPANKSPEVIFFGDSITALWKLANYFQEKPYLNRGIGGQTSSQMLVRFRQDVVNLHPRAVVIIATSNDLAGNSGPMLTRDMEGNYASICEIARANRIAVILGSMLPVHNYTPASLDFYAQRPMAKIRELNDWLKNYAAQNQITYIDYFSVMLDDKGLLKSYYSEDGLHPNSHGYAAMAPLTETAIEQILAH